MEKIILLQNHTDYHLGFEVQSPKPKFFSWDATYEEVITSDLVGEKVDFTSVDFPQWLTAPDFASQSQMQSQMHQVIDSELHNIQSGKFKKYI